MARKAKWTFLVFMAGDNSLSSAGDKDLYEMRIVGSTPDVNIIVEFDNAGKLGTRRFCIAKDGQKEYMRKLAETDCGDPKTLVNFIQWAAKKYPAEHYVLDLWSHGSAWEPAEIDRVARSVGAPQYTPKEAVQRSTSPVAQSFFRSTLETIFRLNKAERAICFDDGSGHSLDTIELGNVLKRTTEILGQPVDILGMDACLMSNIEVAYQARPYVKYIVGSEESEPGDGWSYDAILAKLIAAPDMSPADFATHIVSDYIKFYMDQRYVGDITQSAFDLSRIDTITAPLDALAAALLKEMPDSAMAVWKAQRQAANFFYKTLLDINHFSEILTTVGSPEVCSAAAALTEALKPGPDQFVIAESHNGDRVSRCAGLSIYLPALDKVNRYYGDLDFARDHQWPALLKAYQEA